MLGMLRKLARTAIALGWGFGVASSPALADPATTGELLGDARLIITSNKDDIRIWAHPPRLLVFGDADVRDHILRFTEQIQQTVVARYGPEFFGDIRFADLPADFAEGQERLDIALRRGGPSGANIYLHLGEYAHYEADIVVVVADRPTIAVINGLWGLARGHNRQMLKGGTARCFYSSSSRNGKRVGVLISIFPDGSPEQIEECLWEELLHALGPLQDAVGTEYFSFDNQAHFTQEPPAPETVIRRKRANDLLLLRALYESSAEPGGSPDAVIAYLEGLISADQ